MGSKKAYRLDSLDSFFNQLDSLKIELSSSFGDADLRVEMSAQSFSSSSQLQFDQVILKDSETDFGSSDVFIYVYGTVQSHFRLKLTPTYKPTIDSRLNSAKPLVDRKPLYLQMYDEESEELVSFRPWWSLHENRTICFVSDSMQDAIYFYAEVDAFPLNYLSTLFDSKGILTITADSPQYKVTEGGVFGTYYVRIRPQYEFANLVQNDVYGLYFYAFSQPSYSSFTEMYANNTVLGIANSTENPTQYRHYLTAANQTVVITLTGIFGKGYPALMVKLSSS